jgi:hypothetical protein
VSGPPSPSVVGLLTLRDVRAYLRRSHAVAMTVFFGLLYGLGSMVLGQMLILTRLQPPYYTEIIWNPGPGQGAWNFPALIVWAPWGEVTLPFFATWAMVVVSIGVAIGMSVAVLLSAQLIRQRLARTGTAAAAASVAGLTPAMLALVTLGACCGTTAAATAGVGAFASATGTSTNQVLNNDWLLGAFQIVVVWIALLAQEMLLQVYGNVIGISGRAAPPATDTGTPTSRGAWVSRPRLGAALLRAGLLVVGVTWGLALLVAGAIAPAASAGPVLWAAWLLEYGVIAAVAVLAAMFPREFVRSWSAWAHRTAGYAARAVVLVAGVALVGWVPPPLAGLGFEGFGNEVMGALGAPAAWGAVTPAFAPGPTLFLRWAFQYLFLGGFAIALAVAPARVGALLGARTASVPHAGPSSENDPTSAEVRLRAEAQIR